MCVWYVVAAESDGDTVWAGTIIIIIIIVCAMCGISSITWALVYIGTCMARQVCVCVTNVCVCACVCACGITWSFVYDGDTVGRCVWPCVCVCVCGCVCVLLGALVSMETLCGQVCVG
jgi:hypothetical protein